MKIVVVLVLKIMMLKCNINRRISSMITNIFITMAIGVCKNPGPMAAALKKRLPWGLLWFGVCSYVLLGE